MRKTHNRHCHKSFSHKVHNCQNEKKIKKSKQLRQLNFHLHLHLLLPWTSLPASLIEPSMPSPPSPPPLGFSGIPEGDQVCRLLLFPRPILFSFRNWVFLMVILFVGWCFVLIFVGNRVSRMRFWIACFSFFFSRKRFLGKLPIFYLGICPFRKLGFSRKRFFLANFLQFVRIVCRCGDICLRLGGFYRKNLPNPETCGCKSHLGWCFWLTHHLLPYYYALLFYFVKATKSASRYHFAQILQKRTFSVSHQTNSSKPLLLQTIYCEDIG